MLRDMWPGHSLARTRSAMLSMLGYLLEYLIQCAINGELLHHHWLLIGEGSGIGGHTVTQIPQCDKKLLDS